jgi:ketosteroid isomerase-like protein
VTAEADKRLYGRWLSELWNGDLAVAAEIVARDFVGHWPGEPEKVRGSEALGQLVGETRGHFTDLGFAVEVGPIAEGEIVAARWKGRGTFADGMRVTMHGHDLLRVESGMLSEFWALSEHPTPEEGG